MHIQLIQMVTAGKNFSERMCRHFKEDYGLDVKVVRLHNVYGPMGISEEKHQLQFVEKLPMQKKKKCY